MAYDTYEQSVASGKPIEFYDFMDDFGNHTRITSAGVDLVFSGHTYYSEPCKRSTIRLSESVKRNSMTFELSRDNEFAIQYIAGPLEGKATVTVHRKHQDDAEVKQDWYGVVTQVKFDGNGVPIVIAEPRTSSISSVGRRRRCQSLCDHDLYDAYCMLNEESYRVDGEIDSISGLTITSTTFGTKSDGWFAFGGKLVVGNARRMIVAHTGNNITITRAISAAQAGDSFIAYAGCAHDPVACENYNNKINFGGEENLPKQNPYSGYPIV
jgi:uncharacterized phage protein (TIGR02218 family)